jgi:hypothetical protein
MEYYILVAGNGNTTRANVEALIDDHFIAKGEGGTLVLPFESSPSSAQKWAAQFAKDNNKEIILYAPKETTPFDCPRSSSVVSTNPLEDSIELMAGKDSVGFLLWDDEDVQCSEALRLCKDVGIRCFDLTTGLYEITPSSNIEVSSKPLMPKQEMLMEEKSEDFYEDENEDDEEVEVEEVLTDAITYVAQIFAKEIAAELKKLMGK